MATSSAYNAGKSSDLPPDWNPVNAQSLFDDERLMTEPAHHHWYAPHLQEKVDALFAILVNWRILD